MTKAPCLSGTRQQFHLAESFIGAGDLDGGLGLLERSTFGFHPYVYMALHCRFLDPVRHTPRFQAVLAESHRELHPAENDRIHGE